MNIQIVIGIFITVISFTTGWRLSEQRYQAKEAQRVQQELVNERLQAAQALRNSEAVTKAQNAANARVAKLRKDADSARAALTSLSDAAAQAVRNAQTSHATCLVTATAATDILSQCGERYRGMAETADRHVSDIQTLTDAWPK